MDINLHRLATPKTQPCTVAFDQNEAQVEIFSKMMVFHHRGFTGFSVGKLPQHSGKSKKSLANPRKKRVPTHQEPRTFIDPESRTPCPDAKSLTDASKIGGYGPRVQWA